MDYLLIFGALLRHFRGIQTHTSPTKIQKLSMPVREYPDSSRASPLSCLRVCISIISTWVSYLFVILSKIPDTFLEFLHKK